MEEDIQADLGDNLSIISENISISTVSEASSTYSTHSPAEFVLKKCVRKGDKICYSKLENINMMQDSKKDGYNRQSSYEAADQTDKVLSGESLYKAFMFQQGTNDEETEKCMAFWKSVMEKNLAPIKCNIIENKNKEVPEISEEVELPVELDEEKLKSEMAKIHDEYKNMWVTLLNELQRKRLNEAKLIGKSRCKMCDTSFDENLDKIKKSEIEREIKELNDWDPTSTSKVRSKYQSRLSRQGSILRNRIDVKAIMAKQAKIPDTVKEDSNIYKHIDVIQEKRDSGAYSEWRSNKVETPCPCGYPDCDCNINPAIVSVETPSDSKLQETERVIFEEKDSGGHESSRSDSSEEISDGDEERKEEIKREKKQRQTKTLSVMVQCTCSSSDCDCEYHKEFLKKVNVPMADTDISIVRPPSTVTTTGRKSVLIVSSLELIHRKLESTDRLVGSHEASRKSQPVVPVFFQNFDDDQEDIQEDNLENDDESNDETPKLNKCPCGEEECDCDKEEVVKKALKKCDCSDPACDCEGKKIKESKVPAPEPDKIHELPERYEYVDELQLSVVDL